MVWSDSDSELISYVYIHIRIYTITYYYMCIFAKNGIEYKTTNNRIDCNSSNNKDDNH